MADDVTTLAKFTPAPVNRDAILFAAGRASIPSCRPWQAACAGLLTLQAVTVAAWLAYPVTLPPVAVEPLTPTVVPDEPQPWQSPDPSSYIALRDHLDDPLPPLSSGSYTSPGRPLTVRSNLD